MLFLKMLRDIRENKASYIACIIVVAVGILVFTSMSMVSNNLNSAKERFYKNSNFADGFASVNGIPYNEIDNLAKIKGIKNIEGRLVKDVRVYSEDMNRNVYLRLISVDLNKNYILNMPTLIEGEYLKNNSKSILIDTGFFNANKLKLGDEISLIIEGKKVNFNIVGTEMSPDFVYAMKNSQDIFPNPEMFGVAYIPYEVMKSYFKEKNLVNDISFEIDDNYKYKDIEEELKSSLKNYSLKGIYERKDQVSNLMLSQELLSLEKISKTLPLIFLGIAGFILYIMLKRTIEQQRGQIGILKSFGYSSKEILYHYVSYAIFVGVIGGLIGGLSGIALAVPMTEMYKNYFSIPNLTSSFSIKYMILGIVISLLVSIFAGIQGSKKVLKLEPAEAMRPENPKASKKTLIENIKFFWNSLNSQGKMAVRNISRNKGRSLFTLFGILFAFSLMCTFFNSFDLFDVIFNDQYEKVQVYDCKVSFDSILKSDNIIKEIEHREEVSYVEPMLELPVKLKNHWYEKDIVVMGIKSDSKLYNILNKEGNKITLPNSGIVLSERAAQILNAKVGTELQFESAFIGDEKRKVYVSKIIPQYLGLSAYMNIEELSKLVSKEEIATSIMLKIDDKNIKTFKEYYNKSPLITSIEVKNDLIKKINELMKISKSAIWSLLIFSVILGFIIIYTSSVISFSERERELASLRVMGFSEKEVLEVLSTEQLFISIVSILLGIPITKSMMVLVSKAFSSDLYNMPTTVSYNAVIIAVLGTILSLFIAKLALKRKISKLNLVEVLKERE
ncbi:ABC transporter permease [Clostridium peptidivorans]|uniref:ABC transporter permease n=1 Tax=Clostridium peptidivorans TaxID=100174 RepID=UPI000BE3FA46|nr:FtsX-like permease family protein [Clostridium peptidivorans]